MTALFDPTVLTGVIGERTATYTPDGGQAVSGIWADVQEGALLGRAGSGFDAQFAPGLARYAEGRVLQDELTGAGIASPAFGDTLSQDGVTWRIEQARAEAGFWVLSLSADQRGGR